jgi:hypothetical protein
VSAKILKLSDYRSNDIADSEIDLVTAVDAAIQDLLRADHSDAA